MTDAQNVSTETRSVDLAAWAADQRRKNRSRQVRHVSLVWALRLAVIVVGLLAWQFAGTASASSALTLSNPGAVFQYLFESWPTLDFWEDIIITVREAVIGFLIASLAAVVAAFALSLSKTVFDAMNPILNFFNSLPRIAFAPVFIAWFGLGELPQIVLVVTLCFFVVLSGALVGLSSVDPDLKLLTRQLGTTQGDFFLRITLPSAIPSIFASLRLALIYAFLAAVTGEMLTGSVGAGAKIALNSGLLKMDAVFGILLTLGIVVTIAAEGLRRIELRISRWQLA